jgi:hypothetical protein
MGQPPGHEPSTDLWTIFIKWHAPLEFAGRYFSLGAWQTQKYYANFDEALAEANNPQLIISILTPYGPYSNIQITGPYPYQYFNRKGTLIDLLNVFQNERQLITLGV